MITVLNLIDTGGPGGAETVFLQIASGLDVSRFRSVAAVSHDGWLAERLRAKGIEPLIIPASGSVYIGYLRALARAARRYRADVIAAHLYGTAIYASLAGRLIGVPVVAILHGQSDVEDTGRLRTSKAAILRLGPSKVVFVSNALRTSLVSRLRLVESRCVVIPNGVDTDLFQPGRDCRIRSQIGVPEDAILVGAIGNVRPAKGYEVLLHAARILVKRSERFYFVIAGECSGSLGAELLELRDRLGLASRVTFLGLRSDVDALLRNLDVFVLSSLSEGFSIACVEAMACGLPVVATRCGGPQEILDERTGVLVKPNDPDELADAIWRVVFSDLLTAGLAAAGRKRVLDEYSLPKMLTRYEAVFAEVTGASEAIQHAIT
jgi:glycosyltransferase involved in cell wall biosynthesis